MKRLKKADIIKLRQVDHVISENTILADIDHPFLVSAIGITNPSCRSDLKAFPKTLDTSTF